MCGYRSPNNHLSCLESPSLLLKCYDSWYWETDGIEKKPWHNVENGCAWNTITSTYNFITSKCDLWFSFRYIRIVVPLRLVIVLLMRICNLDGHLAHQHGSLSYGLLRVHFLSLSFLGHPYCIKEVVKKRQVKVPRVRKSERAFYAEKEFLAFPRISKTMRKTDGDRKGRLACPISAGRKLLLSCFPLVISQQ